MARSIQASKKKVGGKLCHSSARPACRWRSRAAHTPPRRQSIHRRRITPRPVITLGEEEISDVNLATFYAFDKENVEFGDRVQLARRGCGGCGCRGCARAFEAAAAAAAAERLRGAILWLRLRRLWLLRRLPGVGWLGLGLGLLAEHARPAGGCHLPPRSPAPSPRASAADHPSKPARTPAQMMTAVVSCARAPSG